MLTGPGNRSETSRSTIVLGREWETLGPPSSGQAQQGITAAGTFGRIASRTDTVEVQGSSSTTASNSSSTHLTDSEMTELAGSKEEGTFTIASDQRTNLSTRTRWEGSRGSSVDTATSSRTDPKTSQFSLDTSVIDVWREVTRKLNNGQETGEGSSVDKGYLLVTNWKLSSTEWTENVGSNEYTLRGASEENRLALRKHHERRTLTGGVDAAAFYTNRREDRFAATAVESTRRRTTDSSGWTETTGSSLSTRTTKSVSTALQLGPLPRVETTTLEDSHFAEALVQQVRHTTYNGGPKTEKVRSYNAESGSVTSSATRCTVDGGKIVIGGAYSNRSDSLRIVDAVYGCVKQWLDERSTLSFRRDETTLRTISRSGSSDIGVLLPLGASAGKRTVYSQQSINAEANWSCYGWWGSAYEEESPHTYVGEVYGLTYSREHWSDETRSQTVSLYGPGGASAARSGQHVEHYVGSSRLFKARATVRTR